MYIKKDLFLNLLISTIPFTFIAGNLILNLNVFVIILFSLIFYRLKIFEGKFSSLDKLIVFFFLYIFFNGAINDYLKYSDSNTVLIKSLGYLRFLALYFIIRHLVKENLINYKFIFFFFGAACMFVAFDLIVQHIFRQDLFGYTVGPKQRVLSGPFGDEYVAGAFIQRFFIFALYFIILFSRFKKSQTSKILIYLSLAFFLIAALLAGNRIPLILFIFILILFFLFEKAFRSQFLIAFVILFSIISINIVYNKNLQKHYYGFVKNSIQIVDYLSTRLSSQKLEHTPNTYTKEIETGILTWQKNKIFGGGIKSFYFNCSTIKNSVLDKYGGTNCNTHPHNYYLQIAGELGIIGLLLSVTIFILLIIQSIKRLRSIENKYANRILVPFFIIFLAEIFPFKTTGSFFTSANSTYLFIIISFMVGLIQINNLKKYDQK